MQVIDQRLERRGKDRITVSSQCVRPSPHRAGGIQHDDNIHASFIGNASGGQLHLGHTGVLEIDTGGGLVQGHRAFVRALGEGIQVGIDCNMQRIVSNGLVAVGNGQPTVGTYLLAVVISVDHGKGHGNFFRCIVIKGNRNDRAGGRS